MSKFKRQVEQEKVLFVHVPKAAGTSIVKSIYGTEDWTHLSLADYEAIHGSEISSYFKFAFVRNPYSRLYSAYNYLKHKSDVEFDKLWRESHLKYDFNTFIESWLTCKNIETCAIDHFRTQTSFLLNSKKEMDINFTGKFESLSKDYQKLMEILSKDLSLSKENAYHYKETFSPASLSKNCRNIIESVYEVDFANFSY
ncbi:sulfotransferase family 2 domain-containing protein [Paraglaciecola sp.]|uniref:sulfotransferase family 2 domain-containing protein n=1 Tax=Paraglaciecola sp. TaxID=1920173 RepID=UPI0030F4A3AC